MVETSRSSRAELRIYSRECCLDCKRAVLMKIVRPFD
jgi:hypothetical protein